MQFRDLTADDIEVRVQSVKQNGLILLLYKNARVDMAILDETVGPENWQREHYECKGNLFCRVGINFTATATPNWVWKSDCGVESNTAKQATPSREPASTGVSAESCTPLRSYGCQHPSAISVTASAMTDSLWRRLLWRIRKS